MSSGGFVFLIARPFGTFIPDWETLDLAIEICDSSDDNEKAPNGP
jgi:hypothetical protein